MTNTPCHWITDAEVPAGRYLVPGCWNRVVHGDDADCHCANRPDTLQEQIDTLRATVERLELANAPRDNRDRDALNDRG